MELYSIPQLLLLRRWVRSTKKRMDGERYSMGQRIFGVSTRFCLGALGAGLFLSITSTSSMADYRCTQLEELHRQYIGVSLSSEQQMLKRKLLAWYNANCRQRRAAR
jgi:hypothetical protein